MYLKTKKFKVLICILFLSAITLLIFQGSLIRLHKKISGSLILNSLKGYNIKSYTNCDIYFTQKDNENAELTALMVSTYMPMLEEEFKIKLNKPIIVIYPNKKELKKALGGVEEAPMGAYYGGIIHILSPQNYFDDKYTRSGDFLKKGPVVHEMVHYFVDEKTSGNYYVWFSEGCALYYEYKYLGYEWHRELSGKTNFISLEDLEKNFRKIDENMAYRKSFEIIKEEMHGQNNDFIINLCEKYRKNSSFR